MVNQNYLDDLRDQIAENRVPPQWPTTLLIFMLGAIAGFLMCRLAMGLPLLPPILP